jgi:hypothetical protein
VNSIIESITTALGPVGSSTLGHALIGLVILIIGLFIVKIIAGILQRILNKVGFLSTNGLVKPISSLIKAVLTVFVLMAVLQHFGLTDVLAPLRDMVDQFVGAIPNIIGAGVIAYVGWILAKLISELVGMALGKVDEQIAERTGNDSFKISSFGSAFIFAGILLPIVVAALGVLNIPAISIPASDMINKLLAAVPNIVGAGIILLVAYYVAKFVVYMLTGLLNGMNINALPEKLGAQSLFSASFTPTKLVGGAIMFFSMLAATTAAVDTLGIDIISNIFAQVLEFGGGLLIGGVILIIGNFLGSMAHQKLSASSSPGVANIARFAILGLVLAMGLRAMGLADNIVNMAFGLTMGGIAVALALAFGLGGRDAAKTIADKWANKVQ